MPSYTRHDTPEIVARIEADLADIVRVVCAGDPHAVSILLTGGFARGEGAVVDGQPQNDYDLIVVHRWGWPHRPYDEMAAELEKRLGLHIDLARVARIRLPYVAPTVFWYETALRGRLVWGEDVRRLIPVRPPSQLRRDEGLRVLVNRAAGLLLYKEAEDPMVRLQASKALLAVLDARMLVKGEFPPSQTERWHAFLAERARGDAGSALEAMETWLAWAYAYKTEPEAAPELDAETAWRVAAQGILEAVPVALAHAGLPTLDAYGRHDTLSSRIHYVLHAGEVPGAHRFAPHPAGTLRVATLHLLEAALRDRDPPRDLERLARPDPDLSSVDLLDALRGPVLQ